MWFDSIISDWINLIQSDPTRTEEISNQIGKNQDELILDQMRMNQLVSYEIK